MASKKTELTVNGRHIELSNLTKILYPAARFTKAQVIDYYTRISPFLLPHLKERPVTLKRYPDGVRGQFFYEKDAPGFTPNWVKTFPVPRRAGGSDIHYILINNLETLVWLANMANLEIHPFLHRVPHLQRPTAIVFDLDPGEGSNVLTCAHVAFLVRELLDQLALRCFPKVSGSKGLQIYIPLNSAADYTVTQPFAKAVADLLCQRHPDLVVSSMSKSARTDKVFIDWSQNADHKSTVSVYSLRAKTDTPFVSMPVTWEELEAAQKADDPSKLYFEPLGALRRVEKLGDLFEPVLKLRQKLPGKVTEKLASSSASPRKTRSRGRPAQAGLRRQAAKGRPSTARAKHRNKAAHPKASTES